MHATFTQSCAVHIDVVGLCMQTAAGQHETVIMPPDMMPPQEQWRKQQVAEAPK
jgi:hypothetical protein